MNIDDPRASAFDEDAFRDAIFFVQQMGLPEDEDLRPTFQWDTVSTYDISDPAGFPYNWSDTPTDTTTHDDVQPICSVKFIPHSATDTESPFGALEKSQAIITLLDTEYAKIEGANKVVLGGDTYFIKYLAPEQGLFGVTSYKLFCESSDES